MSERPLESGEIVFADAERSALLSVDVINGFCKSGALASERVGSIVKPIASLMRRAWNLGVRSILLSQDTHDPQAVEFGAWPAHCVRGTVESEAVDELKALPFYSQLPTLQKNSISSSINTGLGEWVGERPEVNNWVVVGDCTDLCVHQLAMYLRLDADSRQLKRRVIVPMDCVETYDYPVSAAVSQGGLPHPAALIHATFLYHMALNGIEVVKSIL